MATLKLEIVTPEGVRCSEDVDMVTLPGAEGELGIYPQHVPLMTQIVPGEISYLKSGEEFGFAVGPGFAEIAGDHVAILTDVAINADETDAAQAKAAQEAAERRLRDRLGDEQAAVVNAAIVHSLEHVRVRRHKHH